ncbi:hypothetical protein ACWCXB_10590 [Streptomyces sp. NPDC001514]
MIRAARIAVLPLLLALAACGTERAGGPSAADSTAPSAADSAAPSAVGATPPADRSALEARARGIESAMELIYVTDVDGFELATQSVGPAGHDGFQSTYVSRSGSAQIHLVVDRGSLTGANCASRPVDSAPGAPVACERDGSAWYRSSPDRHEYARDEGGHVVQVAADRSVDRATLRRAVESVHRADDAELDAVLPAAPTAPASPVERGDLPPVGDGAPNNDVGVGG